MGRSAIAGLAVASDPGPGLVSEQEQNRKTSRQPPPGGQIYRGREPRFRHLPCHCLILRVFPSAMLNFSSRKHYDFGHTGP
jgi:hypothetical protein